MLKVIVVTFLMVGFVASGSAAHTNLGNVNGQVALGNTYTTQGIFAASYSFTAVLSSFSAFLTTLNFAPITGIDNFAASLYSGNQTDLTGLTPIATAVLVTLPNGTSSLYVAPMTLAAGDYKLNVSGNAIGSNFSFYNGVMNITPVPEPTTGGLLLVGLGILGLIGRKRLI